MSPKRRTPKPRDLRWTLVDAILRRLTFLVTNLGISPQEFLDRAKRIILEVHAPKAKTTGDPRTFTEVHSLPEIMRFWYRELEFLDAHGKPRPLPTEGPNGFEELVKRSAPGVRPAAALADLIAAGAMERSADGTLVARSFRVIMPGSMRRAEIALYAVDNLLSSLSQNVRMDPSLRTLQTEAVSVQFDRKQLPRVSRQLTEQCAAHMEQTDDWLHHHELPAKSRVHDAATVVVGMYITIRDGTKVAAKKRRVVK
jgi:Family of unknown function (DUF6502)